MDMFGEHFEHVIKAVQTDEFMLAVDVINAGEAAEPLSVAFGIEADHHDLLAGVGGALLAKGLILQEAHLTKIYNNNVM
jgi:hypothetical protein